MLGVEQRAEIGRLHFVAGVGIKEIARLPGTRVREMLEPLGDDGSKTILDDYLREVRPLFVPRRTFQRTVYRPGEVCQFDLWEPREQIPVGYGQTRRGWVVVAALGYSRAGAGDDVAAMLPLPARAPDTDHRWVVRVPADPYLRFDTCDYSLNKRRSDHRSRVGHRRRGMPA